MQYVQFYRTLSKEVEDNAKDNLGPSIKLSVKVTKIIPLSK